MNATEAAEKAMQITREVKEAACLDKQGPEDLIPILVVQFEDGRHVVAGLPDRALIVPATKMLRTQAPGVGVEAIVFTSDALVREYVPGEDDAPESPEDVHHGDITTAREQGDMRVVDCLIATAVDGDGGLAAFMQLYTYDDRGQPLFQDVQSMTGGEKMVDGQVPDWLREAIAS